MLNNVFNMIPEMFYNNDSLKTQCVFLICTVRLDLWNMIWEAEPACMWHYIELLPIKRLET